MSRLLTNKIIDRRLIDNKRTIKRIGEYVSAHDKILWKCIKCENVWKSTYANISIGRGCPKCAINKNTKRMIFTNEDIDKKLISENRKIKRMEDYITAKHSIKWKCLVCTHIWTTTPDKIIHKTGCPQCANNKKKLSNEIIDNRILHSTNNIIRLDDFINIKQKIRWKCNKNHIWLATPDRVLAGTRCPKCNMIGNYRLTLDEKELQLFANLYFVRFISKTNNESFTKIGITKREITTRFAGYIKNYNINILYKANIPLKDCIKLEQNIIHKMKQYQYIPEGKFGGKTECFVDIPEVEEKILQLLE